MNKKIFVYILICIIIIGVAIFLTVKNINNKQTVKTNNNVLVENINNNTIKNENVVNNTISNEVVNENITNKVATPSSEVIQTDEEKAIEIVKNNWGEDDTVSFKYDHKENDNYYISVVDNRTSYVLYWYIVDIETGAFTIEQ